VIVKSVQRSITPISLVSTDQQMKERPRLRSSSPGNTNLNTSNANNNAINSSFQNNLFAYGYNSTAFQSKPKWKF